MSIKISEPGDVKITRLEIKNKNLSATVSPFDQLLGIDIYEDMSKPTLYATLIMSDNIDMINKFPLIGEEEVSIEFQTPGMTKPTRYDFICFEIANIRKEPNGKGVTYMMRCVSKEHLFNGSSAVTKSITDTISNMVPALFGEYLHTEKSMIIDPTRGIQTIAFPRLSPLQCIDMVRQRAVSKEFPSSSYVFFENQAGFNFKTIEGLIKDGKPTIGSREFNAQENTMASKETQAASYRTILHYENIVRADSNLKAQEGVYKAVTKTFDLATKEFGSSSFNMKNLFAGLQTPGKSKQIPNSDNFISEYASGQPKQFFTPKDSSRPDNFIDTAMAARNAYTILLNSDVTRVSIHGDSGLKAGDLIRLNLPEASGITGKKKRDEFSSGNYLIIRLRHSITPSTKTKHQIVFDCVKMGI